jgi:hypothetical protein
MTVAKPKMSASYKAIFILSIFMVFFVLVAGAVTNSKTSGFGMWIWGYTAWLMYKRRNSDLVSLYKFLLWFDAIAAGVVVSILLFSDSDVSKYVGYSFVEVLVLFVVVFLFTFGLFKYFKNLQNTQTFSDSYEADDSSLWEQVTDEVKSGKRVDSLWTRAFSETDGDANKANARYIKLRFDQIKSENKSFSSSKTVKTVQSNSPKIRLNLFDFWNHFNLVGRLSLIAIVFLCGYAFYDSYNNNSSSKVSISNNNINAKSSTNKIAPLNSYLQINLSSSMDEVKYALGIPSAVLFEDKMPFKLNDGSTVEWSLVQATKEDISKKKGVDNFFYWHFNFPDYRVDINFDPALKRVTSIGCYVSDSSSTIPKECSVLNFNVKDEEATIKAKLGNPSKEEISGVTKTLFYNDLNLKLLFVKKRLYYIIVEDFSKIKSAEGAKPKYDDVGWTQDSTGSKEIGPWLNYSPKGTRYCRYSDGVIQRLYPPGVKPNAEKANPFCLGDSTSNP